MNPEDEAELLKLFQNLNENKDPLKSGEVSRKTTFLNYIFSVNSLNSKSVGILLERDLNRVSRSGDKDRWLEKIKEVLKEQNIKVPESQTGIAKMITSAIPKLSCSDSVMCSKSECPSEENFAKFLSLFNGKRFKENEKVEVKPAVLCQQESFSKASKDIICGGSEKRNISSFRTAGDELNMQQSKIGCNNNNYYNDNTRQRKRLGTRRYVGSKFISPMLSNNDSSEETSSKSQEWVQQATDDRLKNIEPRMVELIRSEIMDNGPGIQWNDIAGLEFAKTAIQEAVVWPMLRPDIFTGLRRPPKGILLFGPPGTGKTLIGKCVASQSKSTFFSISASSLTSKWVGDGEKMVRALFAVARCHQPAVIFIDEIDSLLSQRSETEHESSRRIKTEFLVQLDGATTDNEERLLVIGATNRPQELDEAARRRFVKRLYIPLPELEARLQLVTKLMSNERHQLTHENMMEISSLSDGYSGADMRTLCADASMGPIRSIDVNLIQSIETAEVRPINMEDFRKALNRVRSSVSPDDLNQYVIWDNTYGSGSFS